MLAWIGVILGTAFAGVSSYLAARRTEGPATARRRLPWLGLVSAVTAGGLLLVALTDPGEWWNYLLIPASTYEWYTALIWRKRRAEAGGVHVSFRQPPGHRSLLLLAGLAIFGGVMDLRAGGVSVSNLILFGLGASNVAVYVAVSKARPGLVNSGILLLDRLLPWESIDNWQLSQDAAPRLDIVLKDLSRSPDSHQSFALESASRDRAGGMLRENVRSGGNPVAPAVDPNAQS